MAFLDATLEVVTCFVAGAGGCVRGSLHDTADTLPTHGDSTDYRSIYLIYYYGMI